MRLVFVAFYFEPLSKVGAKRISYWAENIKSLNQKISIVDVITSNPNSDSDDFYGIDNVYNVLMPKDKSKHSFGQMDIGSIWEKPLKNFLRNHLTENKYDFAIITGNPFGHFSIQKYFKSHAIKTILDFRDPFANNPRSPSNFKNFLKNIAYTFEEYRLIKNSYFSIVVNIYCQDLIFFRWFLKDKIEIIENGYDERSFKSLLRVESPEIDFIYTGNLFPGREASSFVNTILTQTRKNMHFVGSSYSSSNARITNHGRKTYLETISLISSSEVAVLFATGYKFESTTKVFDYIALNKIILVVSSNKIMNGALIDILKHYPKAVFTSDAEEDLLIAFQEISLLKLEKENFNTEQYSRLFGLNKLTKLLC